MPFQAILTTLVDTHAPVARAAILCDEGGERVAAFAVAGIDEIDLDLLGATLVPVAARLAEGELVRVLHTDRVVWISRLEGGCSLVVLAEPGRDAAIRFDIPRAVAAIAAHM